MIEYKYGLYPLPPPSHQGFDKGGAAGKVEGGGGCKV